MEEVVEEDIVDDVDQNEEELGEALDDEVKEELVELQGVDAVRQLDELGYYKTHREVKQEVRNRRHTLTEISAIATWRSIENEMDSLQGKKRLHDEDIRNMEYEFEKLAEKTILFRDSEPLQSVPCDRICQIENRLRYDPSLQLTEDDLDFTVPERADVYVRQKLADAYVKVKVANWNIEDRVRHHTQAHATSARSQRSRLSNKPVENNRENGKRKRTPPIER